MKYKINNTIKPVDSDFTESTRVRLITAAGVLFTENGYHGTSTDMIAQACCIQKSSIFSYFKKKEDIALEIITQLQ